MYDLDFSLLPQITRHRIFTGLPSVLEKRLCQLRLPETLDRLRAVSYFLGHVGAGEEDWLNRGRLRAALSEFRSVREALRWDIDNPESVHGPGRSANPLVHLVYRLRRIAVYVDNVDTSQETVTATIKFDDRDHHADVEVILIEDIEAYLRKENLKDYADDDISRICDWFEVNQRIFGAPQVLEVGVMQYCEELCRIY